MIIKYHLAGLGIVFSFLPVGQEALQHLLPFSSWLSGNEGLEESGLPRVLGVLGDTRIPIRLPAGKPDSESDAPEAKRSKNEPHPDSWLNLELVCNDKGRFIYCHISKGSEKDRGSALAERIRQNPEMLPARDLPDSRSRIPAHRTNTYPIPKRSKPAGKPLQPIGWEPFRPNKPGGGGLKRAIPEIEILGYGKLRQGESSGSDCLYITQCFSGHGGCDKGTDGEKHNGRCGRGQPRCCWGENERDCSEPALQHTGSSTTMRFWHLFAYLKGQFTPPPPPPPPKN